MLIEVNEAEFQERKLGELIVLISELSHEDPSYGDVKLNKLLFFSDFLAFSNLGEPITGVPYFKLQHGPAPRRLLPVRAELMRRGAVRCEKRGVAYVRNVTIPQRPADRSVFLPQEIALVREVVDLFEHADATTISDISHRVSAGWNLVGLREVIPYESALIATDPPSDAALSFGRELAAHHGW
jgi:Protein of unknown function (DUF4065)